MQRLMRQLSAIRKRRNISYLEIEKQTGIPFARMKKLESGEESITVEELEKLLAFFRLSYDQVLRYGRRRRFARTIPALAAAVLLLAGAVYAWNAGLWKTGADPAATPEPAGSAAPAGDPPTFGGPAAAPASSGTPASSGSPESPDSPGSPGRLDTPGSTARPGGGLSGGGLAGSGVPGDGPASAGEAEPAGDPAPEAEPPETVLFRFWGNIPYHAAELPRAPAREASSGSGASSGSEAPARIIEVFPVQYLDDRRPDWLRQFRKEDLILNFGTSEVWTPTTKEAYEALRRDGYQVIGLGTTPDVYEPLIVEVNGLRIGFLSLAGLIRNAEEVALPTRVGLPRAYRTDEVTKAVTEAKEKADYLFVLIDWGRTYLDTPNTSQRVIGGALIGAGADAVIGNRPERAQEFMFPDGKPLFYALGHSVSSGAEEGSFNLMVEARFTTRLDELAVNVGKLSGGVLRFDLNEEDRERIRAAYDSKAPLPEPVKLVW